MGLDKDFSRDRADAFGPASRIAGGILPYEGRALVRRSEGLWAEALGADEDAWLSPDNPVLVRGQARILPLAWRGDPTSGRADGVTSDEIAELATQMEGSGYFWARSGRTLDELEQHRGDSNASYAAALRAAGVTKATFWTISGTVGIALVWAGSEDAGTESLALHVVPASWISETFVAKAVKGIDVSWSWSDVIDLYSALVGADSPGAPGSLAGQETEGQGS